MLREDEQDESKIKSVLYRTHLEESGLDVVLLSKFLVGMTDPVTVGIADPEPPSTIVSSTVGGSDFNPTALGAIVKSIDSGFDVGSNVSPCDGIVEGASVEAATDGTSDCLMEGWLLGM
jgi:hypothetical protein